VVLSLGQGLPQVAISLLDPCQLKKHYKNNELGKEMDWRVVAGPRNYCFAPLLQRKSVWEERQEAVRTFHYLSGN